MHPEPLKYEDAAEPVTVHSATGDVVAQAWMGKRSRIVHSDEHVVRYHNCTDCPCRTEGCPNRTDKGYTICEACRDKEDWAKWYSRLEKDGVDWDGIAPLAEEDGDRFLFDADSVQDYLDSHLADGNELDMVRLVLANPDNGPCFEMNEWLSDHLPEESDQTFDDIDKTVNDWLKAHGPFCWWPTGRPVRPESLRKYAGKLEETQPTEGT